MTANPDSAAVAQAFAGDAEPFEAGKPFLRPFRHQVSGVPGGGAGSNRVRPPVWLMRQAGRYLPEYREVRGSVDGFLDLCFNPALATEVTLQPIRRYGLEAAILFSDILVVPWALGQPLRFVEGAGPVLEPLSGTGNINRLAGIDVVTPLAPVYEAVASIRAALPRETTLIGFAGAPWTVACYMVEGGSSREWLAVRSMAWRSPEEFGALMAILERATVTHLLAQVRAGAEVIQIFETWAGLLPPTAFARWVIEPTKRIVAALKAAAPGVPVIGFPRAAGANAIAYAALTGIDGLSLDTGVSLRWAAETLPAHLVLQGNLDPVALVAGGRALDQEVARILDEAPAGRHVFNLGHGILPTTPPEHVARMLAGLRPT